MRNVLAPPLVPNIDSTRGLINLVSMFRKSIDYPHHTWLPPMSKTVVNILQSWALLEDDELREALHAAAFLLIPGLVRVCSITNERPVDLLNEAAALNNPVMFLINKALDYVRAGLLARPDHEETHRSPAQLKRQVDTLVGKERYSAAMEMVERMHATAAGVASLSYEEQRAEIERLHPAADARDQLGNMPHGCPHVEAPPAKDVIHHVRRLRTRCTSGYSGWTNRLIQRVVLHSGHTELLANGLSAFFGRWFAGKLGHSAAQLFSVSRAVLIPKADGGHRPLGIGEAWYRLAARIITAKVAPKISRALAPIQLGTGFKAGAEICARLMQLALERDDDDMVDVCVFSLDIQNAFNTIRRKHILDGIRAHYPELEPFFRLFYSSPSELRFSDGSYAGTSATGARQGDPPAMLYFALGFHKPLLALRALHATALREALAASSAGHIQAYADDVVGSLPAAAVGSFCAGAETLLASYGLTLVRHKCGIHGRLAHTIPDPIFPIFPNGLKKVLGCPVGPVEFRVNRVRESLDKMTACIPTLRSLGRQSAYILLTQCVNQRAQYLTRILEFGDRDGPRHFKIFDERIDAALRAILDCPLGEAERLHTMRCLPTRLGGLGVYPHGEPVAEHGKNASRIETYEFAKIHYQASLLQQIPASWHELSFDLPVSETSRTLTSKEAQDCLLEVQEGQFTKVLVELRQTCSARAAWLVSSRVPNSGRWILYSGGVANRFRMDEQPYVDALRRRCLLDLSPAEKQAADRICNCEPRDVVQHATHLLDCPRNQWFFQKRHNTMCLLVGRLIRKIHPGATIQYEFELRPHELEAGLSRAREPTPLSNPAPDEEDLGESGGAEESKEEEKENEEEEIEEDERDRMERAAAEAAEAAERPAALRADIFVMITNPACRSCLRCRSDRFAGRAAKMREKRKRIKYGGLPGMGPEGAYGFTPFVVEATGRLGAAARNFIKKIAGCWKREGRIFRGFSQGFL
jgi:hypothetical protein